MNKARKEMILHVWEQYEVAKGLLDREYVIRSQELVAGWAEKNGIDLNKSEDLETLQDKLQEDEEMVEKSKEISIEFQAKWQHLLFEQLVPAIDKSKLDCKDGIITPDDVREETGGSAIIMP